MDVSFEDYLQDVSAEESALVDDDDEHNDNHHALVDDQSSALTEDDLFPDDEQNENSQDASNVASSPPSTPIHKHSSTRGPMSPFSPMLMRRPRQQSSAISWQEETSPDLSLIPCRKVSVAVRVKIPDEQSLCLFPFLPGEACDNDVLSPTTLPSTVETNDIVVVNPSAFGKFIPAEVTVETARLVANVANIESEDWARRYRFDQVLWPHTLERDASLQKLACSMANDAVLRQQSSVCLGIGGRNSGRTETMFGVVNGGEDYGLLGLVVASVLNQLDEHAVCTLSLAEIVEEDVLRDLLVWDSLASQSRLKIRHTDNKGAIVQNLCDVPLDSMTGLEHLMRRAFHSNDPQQTQKHNDGTRGHVIATINVWQNSVHLDLGNRNRCTNIVLADLASGEEGDARHMASFRKSVSGLRGVLRSLLQQEVDGQTASAASYRECTLTRVLQRHLTESRTVVLATVSASTDSYERTLHTLNYMNRLLIRPGKTARSPFERHGTDSPASSTLLDQYADNEALLESMLSDPRQRLAKVIRPRYSGTPVKLDLSDSSHEGYEPYDYMQLDPGAINEMHSSESPENVSTEESAMKESKQDVGAAPENGVSRHGKVKSNKVFATVGTGEKQRVPEKNTGDFASTARDLANARPAFASADSIGYAAAVVSLSEESSIPPMESKTAVSKSAIETTSNDVDEWIASFEADSATDVVGRVGAGASLSDAGDETMEGDQVVPAKEQRSSHVAPAESDDASVSELMEAVTVLSSGLDEIAALDVGHGKFGANEPGRTDTSGHVIEVPGRSIKDASTPQASWPELQGDDDESALSLTSLQQDAGTQGKSQSERRPEISASSDRFSSASISDSDDRGHEALVVGARTPPSPLGASDEGRQVKSLPLPGREEQKPGESRSIPSVTDGTRDDSFLKSKSAQREGASGKGVLSPSDECLGEIHVLEDAVEQIKRLHNGLWETSTLSLDRLRHSQLMQQRAIEQAIAGRRDAEAEMELLRSETKRLTDEKDRASHTFEQKITELESRIEKVLADRSDMETIAEEAIAAQDRLEQDLLQTQTALEEQKDETKNAVVLYNELVESRNTLATKLEVADIATEELRATHSVCDSVIADLKETIAKLKAELEELRKERDSKEEQSEMLFRMAEERDRLEHDLENSKEENVALREDNDRLASDLRDYEARFHHTEDLRDSEYNSMKAELTKLQDDFDLLQRRCREVEVSRERAAQEYEEERSASRNELADVNKRLDIAHAKALCSDEANEDLLNERFTEIDFLTSEMHSLKIEKDRDVKRLRDTEQAFEKLKLDAKDKLRHLVNQKKAASSAIERLKEENAAHVDSNRHLRARIDRAEHDRRSLQQRFADLQDRLDVEQAARQEAENRIRQLESRRSLTESETLTDRTSSFRRSDSHLEQYTEAERALLKEIEAETSDSHRLDGNAQSSSSRARGEESDAAEIQRKRTELAKFRRDLDARYFGSPETPAVVSVDIFREEKARRKEAEDVAAAMAANAKEALEKRNQEILSLKLQLSAVADEKESEILKLRSRLHSIKRESLT